MSELDYMRKFGEFADKVSKMDVLVRFAMRKTLYWIKKNPPPELYSKKELVKAFAEALCVEDAMGWSTGRDILWVLERNKNEKIQSVHSVAGDGKPGIRGGG